MFSKKQKKLKTVQLITKRKKLSAQLIVKQIANSSADYQTEEIIYPMDFKTDYFVFKKSKRNWNSSADY